MRTKLQKNNEKNKKREPRNKFSALLTYTINLKAIHNQLTG